MELQQHQAEQLFRQDLDIQRAGQHVEERRDREGVKTMLNG
jgi:hypothetical protein